jgi:hypothetical protein
VPAKDDAGSREYGRISPNNRILSGCFSITRVKLPASS